MRKGLNPKTLELVSEALSDAFIEGYHGTSREAAMDCDSIKKLDKHLFKIEERNRQLQREVRRLRFQLDSHIEQTTLSAEIDQQQ